MVAHSGETLQNPGNRFLTAVALQHAKFGTFYTTVIDVGLIMVIDVALIMVIDVALIMVIDVALIMVIDVAIIMVAT
jgi:hypothetical protein